jgi:hypothetical protein
MVLPPPSGVSRRDGVWLQQLAKRLWPQRTPSNKLRKTGPVLVRLDMKSLVTIAIGFAAAGWLRGGLAHALFLIGLIALGAGLAGLLKSGKDGRYDP